jgi:hypothetical protein
LKELVARPKAGKRGLTYEAEIDERLDSDRKTVRKAFQLF